MRTLGFSRLGFSLFLALALLSACATVSLPPPLTAADVVALTKQGRTPKEIIGELNRTRTVLPLRASDYVALHEAGVAKEVLDYLQLAQIDDIRWRERSMYWYGPGFGPHFGWGPCPWPYRGRWGC
jgi:hypothetical protein